MCAQEPTGTESTPGAGVWSAVGAAVPQADRGALDRGRVLWHSESGACRRASRSGAGLHRRRADAIHE